MRHLASEINFKEKSVDRRKKIPDRILDLHIKMKNTGNRISEDIMFFVFNYSKI